jgi:hypothetical protein
VGKASFPHRRLSTAFDDEDENEDSYAAFEHQTQ